MSREGSAKRLRGEEADDYEVVDGERYSRRLLQKARVFAGDGWVSIAEARELWEEAAPDGTELAETEAKTLLYTLSAFRYTAKAASFLRPLLQERRPRPHYKQIDGVVYDRALLDKAEAFARDGQISFAEARQLWEEAQDGKALAAVDRRTLLHTLATFRYTEKAAAFLRPMLEGEWQTPQRKPGKGAKRAGLDHELRVKAAEFAKDGWISFAEASSLWGLAQRNNGITELEQRALLSTLEDHRYTQKAATFMRQRLQNEGADKERKAEGKGEADGAVGRAPCDQVAKGTEAEQGRRVVTVRWRWTKRRGSGFPSFPVVQPRREHRFSLVLCHPLGCNSTFFLGPSGLVKDLLVRSRLIRDHCKILCPGAQRLGWGKQWFRYRSNKGGTRDCHADVISSRDLQRTVRFVSRVVDMEVTRLGSPLRVALGGYSQGGCVSLAVGLGLPYVLGLVVSQRGMLMKQTMDAHSRAMDAHAAGSSQEAEHPQGFGPASRLRSSRLPVFMTAGAKDDVYLLANQLEAKAWLEGRGCTVRVATHGELDHYEQSMEEHAAIRRACAHAYRRAAARTPEPGGGTAGGPGCKRRRNRSRMEAHTVSAVALAVPARPKDSG
mmetsp:Transcript_30299/g.96863  ORF Transcript_30299/g.96863 Transcript_30299/m.96863 type:complete len:609 (-) Transcript_30299:117-1943(-)